LLGGEATIGRNHLLIKSRTGIARMTSSRVLVRILIGLNVVLLLGYFAQVVLAVQTGSNPGLASRFRGSLGLR
jgi:hypothetical protein